MTSNASRFLLICITLACAHAPLAPLEWPVTEVVPFRFFGQRSEGAIERGITFEKAETVHAAGHGTVLITIAQNRNMSGFPGTLGNAVILSHDDGLLTVYGNLEDLDRLTERVQIDSLSMLGSTGKSSWGRSKNFIFQVIDGIKKNVLNPMLLLPSLKDTRPPSIQNVVAVSSDGQIYALGSVKSVRQGKYKLYADITDALDGLSVELSPFRTTVLVNGSESLAIPFEILRSEKGMVYLSSPEYEWENLYSDPGRMYLGGVSLTRGRSDISIIARDTAGNERSVLFGLQID